MRALALPMVVLTAGTSFCGILLGQSTVVLPKGFAKITGLWSGIELTFGSRYVPMHVQSAYDVRDLGLSSAILKSIAFRSINYPWYSQASRTQGMTFALSHGPNAPRTLSTTFAANEGKDRKVVFSSNVLWPKDIPVKGVPPFAVRVPFSSPFPFVQTRGKSLVVDVRITSSTALSGDWQYDLALWDWGKMANFNHNQANCKDSAGRRVYETRWVPSNDPLQPGGRFSITYLRGGTPNAQGMASVGLQGVGGKWAGATLPIDLTPMGAPGCYAAVASLAWWPFTTNAFGTGTFPPVAIPNRPNVIGVHFFDQSYLVDRKANALGIVPIFSSEWVIGSGVRPSVGTIHMVNDNPPKKVGWRYLLPTAPIVEFSY